MRTELKKIFVGRTTELSVLETLWLDAQKPVEHFVYVYFNAPGVGKTTLLQHFGSSIHQGKEGLHFSYSCTGEFSNRVDLLQSLFEHLDELVLSNYSTIIEYIESRENGFVAERRKEDLTVLSSELKYITKERMFSIGRFISVLKRLSNIIPIFLSFDEVQVFEQVTLPKEDNQNTETLLHYLTRILKAFLSSKILLVLSGTQYHILRDIGSGIGSPIKDKTLPKIISPFDEQEMIQYASEVNHLLGGRLTGEIWDYFLDYLISFSGGHPRTITKIVEQIEGLLSRDKLDRPSISYELFVKELHDEMKAVMIRSTLRSDQRKALVSLQSSQQFVVVKDWLIRGTYNRLVLGPPPSAGEQQLDDEVERLVFQLMTIGIIVQNGNETYYLTSYFHLLLFLETIQGEHELFLREVLQNHFFPLLCGGHAGLGYTFENIILSALLARESSSEAINSLPFDVSKIKRLEKVKGLLELRQFKFEEQVLYHTPSAKAIDAFILLERSLHLLQVTSIMKVPATKLNQFKGTIKTLEDHFTSFKVNGWFISLFDIEEKLDGSISLTTGQELQHILGKSLYDHLIKTKAQM